MRNFWVYCILHEQEILQQIQNAIKDPGPRTNGGGHSGISNPTEAIAMRELTTVVKEVQLKSGFKVKYPQYVIKAIKYTKARINLNKELGAIYQARFIYMEKWYDTCKRLDISQQTYNKRLWKIANICEDYRKRLRKKNGIC